MNDLLKNKPLLALAVAGVVLLVITVSSCNSAASYRRMYNEEYGKRMDAEESSHRQEKEFASLQGRTAALEGELAQEKTARQTAETALLQERLVNESLKKELEKVTRMKEALEQDLKQALLSGKGTPKPAK